MRLLQFGTSGPLGRRRHLGALVEGTADDGVVIDLSSAGRALLAREGVSLAGIRSIAPTLAPCTMLAFIEGGARTRDLADRALDAALADGTESDPFDAPVRFGTADVTVLPAITAPPMLRDFMAFEKHLVNVFPRLGREIPEEWYRRPVYYKANTAAIGAHDQDVAFPPYTEQLDLEFEFAAILGRDGTGISEDSARDHIFGYTVYDDLSARAIQSLEMTVGLGPAKGKDFHGAHVLGPVVVTADEVPDPYALAMTGTVDGETWTVGSSSDMHWRFEQMIAYASMGEPLRAGEVFGSGTVGDGSGAEQDRWLEPGNVIELTVEGIGTLRNRVVATGDAAPARDWL
jgi:2-keto-4-pentenoate hydratase/2-oxohepta-3-ene-1,7-dioic acid hydratase in catechol pathway